ncbi:hypothetical protein [Streptosporangium sp. NPDC003464]
MLAKKGDVACIHCRKRERANKRRAEMIRLGRVLPMVEVIDVKTSTRSWCLRCWQVCDPGPRLDNIRNGGQGGCEACGGKKRFADEVARQLAKDWGYNPDPDVPYQNDATKWPGRCIAKGHPCAPVLNSRFSSGPCEICPDHGFKPDRPALLYLVTRLDLAAAKIGICEDSPKNSRLYEHNRNGWTKIEIMRFGLGAHARTVEDTVIRSWRALALPPVLDNGLAYNGYTETVSLNSLSVTEIWSQVQEVADQVLSTVPRSRDVPYVSDITSRALPGLVLDSYR